MPEAKYAGRYREYNRTYDRESRHEAVANGLCGRCRKVEVKPGCKRCIDCLIEGQEAVEQQRAEYRAEGRCWCGGESRPGLITCQACADRRSKYRPKRSNAA